MSPFQYLGEAREKDCGRIRAGVRRGDSNDAVGDEAGRGYAGVYPIGVSKVDVDEDCLLYETVQRCTSVWRVAVDRGMGRRAGPSSAVPVRSIGSFLFEINNIIHIWL